MENRKTRVKAKVGITVSLDSTFPTFNRHFREIISLFFDPSHICFNLAESGESIFEKAIFWLTKIIFCIFVEWALGKKRLPNPQRTFFTLIRLKVWRIYLVLCKLGLNSIKSKLINYQKAKGIWWSEYFSISSIFTADLHI